jgi:hypothetical protein
LKLKWAKLKTYSITFVVVEFFVVGNLNVIAPEIIIKKNVNPSKFRGKESPG